MHLSNEIIRPEESKENLLDNIKQRYFNLLAYYLIKILIKILQINCILIIEFPNE